MYYPCENCFAFECCNCTFGNQSIEMQELCDIWSAKRAGRLVVLPCKVGDTIWRIFNGEIIRYNVVSVSFNDHIKPRFLVECSPFCRFYWGDGFFGKTFFRTREEAEAKLKEVESDG